MKVFKYRGGGDSILRRDLKSLSINQFFSAPIESLNDPFEAKVKVHGESFEFGKFLQLFPTFKYNEDVKKSESSFIELAAKFIEESKSWRVYSLSQSYDDELSYLNYPLLKKVFHI